MFTQQIINGIVTGAVYALLALGLTLVFGMHRILNFAHGAVFMWGGLIGYYLVTAANFPFWAAFVCAMVGAGLISICLDLLVFRPLRRRKGDELSTIVASIGANLVLITIAQQVTNAQSLRFPFDTFPLEFYRAYGLQISSLQVVIIVTVVLMVGGLLVYLFKTPLGAQVRAVSIDEPASTLLGVNPARVYLQTFFLSGMLAGAAGVIIGLTFNSISYTMGESLMLQAFVVIILGGLGSIVGTVAAGVLIGMIQTLVTAYISSELSDAILFGILFIVLLVRPNGIFAGFHVEHRAA